MSDGLRYGQERAIELLELHDRLDLLDEELRVQRIALLLTPLVSILLGGSLLAVLFVNRTGAFTVYASVFTVVLGAIVCVLLFERRRLRGRRDSLRSRIREEEASAGRRGARASATLTDEVGSHRE
jgi:hypothetical protein